MCTTQMKLGNPIRGRLNSCLFYMLDGYVHYKYGKRKTKLFADLPKSVVEIGPGGGANMRYLKTGTRMIAIEPNPYMHKRLRAKARKYAVNIDIRPSGAERMDIASNSVDAVFSTLTLCTIGDEKEGLNEIKRVLKPGGKFFFLEHVGARKGSLLRKIQEWVHRPWFWLFEGCHTHKDIAKSIRDAGFAEVHMENFKLYSPFIPITPQISGYALK